MTTVAPSDQPPQPPAQPPGERVYVAGRWVIVRPLTARQAQVLAAIVGFLRRHRYAPTKRELCLDVGLQSEASLEVHLAALERKGRIRRVPGVGRSIVVLRAR